MELNEAIMILDKYFQQPRWERIRQAYQIMRICSEGKFIYKVSAGNPEGFDCFYTLSHTKKYSQEEFVELIENILAECYEEHYEKHGFSYLDSDTLEKKLELVGFKSECPNWQASYDLEPYWGKDRIKSKRLLDAINLKEKESL
jgi:hypothetical protein